MYRNQIVIMMKNLFQILSGLFLVVIYTLLVYSEDKIRCTYYRWGTSGATSTSSLLVWEPIRILEKPSWWDADFYGVEGAVDDDRLPPPYRTFRRI